MCDQCVGKGYILNYTYLFFNFRLQLLKQKYLLYCKKYSTSGNCTACVNQFLDLSSGRRAKRAFPRVLLKCLVGMEIGLQFIWIELYLTLTNVYIIIQSDQTFKVKYVLNTSTSQNSTLFTIVFVMPRSDLSILNVFIWGLLLL